MDLLLTQLLRINKIFFCWNSYAANLTMRVL